MEREYQAETASTSSNFETFGTRLKRLRTERQISQAGFARRLGVSKPTVWKWERDEVRPRPKSLKAAASVLGVTESDLAFSGVKACDATPTIRCPHPQNLSEIVSLCKEQIAQAAGIRIDNILITIHV
jgi:transcriptional regulator with XRE-family HTH domain